MSVQILYTIVSVNDYKDASASRRNVNCALASSTSSSVPGSPAIAPMISYQFEVKEPTSADLAAYDVGCGVTVTITPTATTPAS